MSIVALVCAILFASRMWAQPVRTDHLSVELITESQSIAPGHDFLAGLHFILDKGWHIYWSNPGDAGLPPQVAWKLPPGITAGDIQFPAPERLPLGPLMDYGYSGDPLLLVPMHASNNLKTGSTATLRGHVDFLVCSNVCVPGRADVNHSVPVTAQPGPPNPQTQPLFLATKRALPRSLPAGASVSASHAGSAFTITLQTGRRIAAAEYYPLAPDVIANAAPQTVTPIADGVRIAVTQDPTLKKIPSEIAGVVKLPDGTAYRIQPAVSAAPAPPVAAGTTGASGSSLARILGLAFLGGLILNLMPCVFPVLFIKGLSLVNASDEERNRLRTHGAMYALGILVSFWAVVGILLLLRLGGSQIGWGFQFQSPYFVAVMALLFFFLGLSLAGQFEIGLSVTSLGQGLARRQGYSGSFFTGILATVVATPCTAPFMGAAIGFALSRSAAVTFLVFTVLALGLASPYVALTLQPAWTRWMPRPGPWMEYLRKAVSIPIFIAVIWMVWVFAQVVGATGVAALLSGMLVVAVAGWVLGHWPARRPSTAAAVLLLAIAVAVPSFAAKRFQVSGASNRTVASTSARAFWQPFSPKQLASDRAEGRPVFVDFSAAWCLTCQVNERLVLDRSEVKQAFQNRGVTTMRADWTNYDDAITKALTHLGRNGVPTYALYSGDAKTPPKLLPEVLTQDIVLNALHQLPTNQASVAPGSGER
jgi:thiol:disulfide interchange protein DsbD